MLSAFISSCFSDWGKYGESHEIGLFDCATREIRHHMTQLFMGINGSAAMIVFRGYDRFHAVMDDIDRTAIPFDIVNSGARVNGVLLNVYRDAREHVMKYLEGHGELRTVHLVGHSMGGGLATIAAVDIANVTGKTVYCHTFGCPKVGDAWFKKVYEEKVHFTNRYVITSDPVPLYPWEREYVHVCSPINISPIIDRIPIWMGIMKHFLMMLVGMSKRDMAYHVVSKFSGLEGHQLYNYAFSIRKFS